MSCCFGDGTVEDTLDGGPSVTDSYWWVISISQYEVNEFPGMWARKKRPIINVVRNNWILVTHK